MFCSQHYSSQKIYCHVDGSGPPGFFLNYGSETQSESQTCVSEDLNISEVSLMRPRFKSE